jgi:hypothetical protein
LSISTFSPRHYSPAARCCSHHNWKRLEVRPRKAENSWVDQQKDRPADEKMNQLVSAVGHVCILASALEFSLAYLTGMIDQWDDDKHRDVLATPGRPLREYRNLVPRIFPALRADAAQLADDAEVLLTERNRVVHSVMMLETADEPRYEAWHARTDTTWPVVPEDLNALAHDLASCAAEATGFAMAWQERAERDGWPVLP